MDDGSAVGRNHARFRRNPARFLAPLALAAVIAAIYLVVHQYVGSASTGSTVTTVLTSSKPRARGPAAHGGHGARRPTPEFYVVAPGDTLSEISAKSGVSLSTLQALNPGLRPNTIQVGQRVRLRR